MDHRKASKYRYNVLSIDTYLIVDYKYKSSFKQDDLRRRREEQQVEIRRQKREENISKRRNFVLIALDSDDEVGSNVDRSVCLSHSS